jgi:glycerophosphoryl diester phosphodiesterase
VARPVIAHRGASGTYPENTLLAFEHALGEGADALELDVRVTADGVPVVIHDRTVDRTTDGSGDVRNLSLAAVERLDAGRGERIPRLEAVLERYPHAPLLMEIKDPSASIPALTVIRRHAAQRRVLIGSFKWRALVPFRRAGVPTTSARMGVAVAVAASRLGIPWPGPVAAYAVPERDGWIPVVDGRFVRLARRAGKPVHVWTVNDPDRARRLRNLGVCGIITDFPAQMRNI